jgi:hypothetical protein
LAPADPKRTFARETSDHPIEPGPKLVERRYDRMLRNIHEEDNEEQVKLFLDALAQAYDRTRNI